jgi:hypothetical protein
MNLPKLTKDEEIQLFLEYLENGGNLNGATKEVFDGIRRLEKDRNNKIKLDTLTSPLRKFIEPIVLALILPPPLTETTTSTYQNLYQKEHYFTQRIISDRSEIDILFDEFNSSQNIIFRGVKESKFRLYSSLQRKWIENKIWLKYNSDYYKLVKELISVAKNEQNSILSKFLLLNKISDENDLSILSFLQHYKCPTPLTDWTYSFPKALFFATHQINKGESKLNIDNFFSVYYLKESDVSKDNFQDLTIEFLNNHKEELLQPTIDRSIINHGMESNTLNEIFGNERGLEILKQIFGQKLLTNILGLNQLKETPLAYFSDWKPLSQNMSYGLLNNLHITAQEGLFIWNNHPYNPLEEVAVLENQTYPNYKFCTCLNINKSLSVYIKNT